jgi:hypothetical protein
MAATSSQVAVGYRSSWGQQHQISISGSNQSRLSRSSSLCRKSFRIQQSRIFSVSCQTCIAECFISRKRLCKVVSLSQHLYHVNCMTNQELASSSWPSCFLTDFVLCIRFRACRSIDLSHMCLYTGLFKMNAGVLTTCNKQYT